MAVTKTIIGVSPEALRVVPPEVESYGDRLTDKERGIFGDRAEKLVRLDYLVTLSQTRNAKNRAAGEIKESVAKELHNPILVAKMTHADFLGYADFVNRLWGVENNVEFTPVDEDDLVHLVIAGHTRVEAIREIAVERVVEGLPEVEGGGLVNCKIYEKMTPKDILAVQMDENLYDAPPQERMAMGVVECYLYGLENGEWKNRAEFLRENKDKRFSYKLINDALHFVALPPEIRDFVLEGGVPYVAGVELGKTLSCYEGYVLAKYFGSRLPEKLSQDELSEFQNNVSEWLGYEVAKLQERDEKGKKKLNSTAVIRGRYESQRATYMAELPAETIDGESPQTSLDTMVDPIAESRIVRRRMRDEHAAIVKRLAADPLQQHSRLIHLHGEILGWDDGDLQELTKQLERDYIASVGDKILSSTSHVDIV